MQTKVNLGKDRIIMKYQIVLFVVMLLLGIIVGNSMYLGGYTAETMEPGMPFIYGSYGYTQNENSFSYAGVEGSCIQVASRNTETEQLMFTFSNISSYDVEYQLYYLDENGNYLNQAETGVWERESYTLKINVTPGQYACYVLAMKADFNILNVYYAKANHTSSNMRNICYVFGAVIGIGFAIITGTNQKIRNSLYAIDEKCSATMTTIKNNKKTIILYIIKFVVCIAILLGGLTLYSKTATIRMTDKLIFATILVGILLGIYIFFRKYAAKKIEIIGFFTILIIGTIFSVVEPPNVGVSWDDEIHYQRAVALSHVLDGQMSMADVTIQSDYQNVALNKYDYTQGEQKYYTSIMNDLIESKYYTQRYALLSTNIQIAYIPSAIGLILGRGMGLSFYATLVMGRWMNVLLLAILAYFSMKKLKTGKIVVMLVCLIPTNIFIASNYTYDTWVTGWMMLGLSTFFGEWQKKEEKIQKSSFWIIGISLLIAVMPKLVYFPISFITLFMPKKKFNNKKELWLYRLVILLATFLPLALVYFQNFFGGIVQGDVRGGEAVNSASQMDFVKEQPILAANILMNFLKTYLNPLMEGREYLINQAYFGYIGIDFRILLGIIIIGCLVSREAEEVKFPWWTKLGTLFVYAVIGFMAAFSMYVSFTAVGSDTVAGCQGRYLMPAFFPLLYVCSRFSFKTFVKNIVGEKNVNIILLLLMSAVCIWGLWIGCLKIY